MDVNPYLHFNGNCAEAFKFYEKCLGGKIQFSMTHGESPMKDQTAPEWRDKIMHISLKVGDGALLGSDAPPQYYSQPQGFTVSITVKDPAEGKQVFGALAESGNITMPFDKTFWSSGFGMVTDKFGISWMVNTQETV